MNASILSIGTAVPPHVYTQEKIANHFIEILDLSLEKQTYLKKIYENSGIQKRHCITEDFNLERKHWNFWGSQYPEIVPGMSQRNDFYKEKAPQLALEAAQKALACWGGSLEAITHVISVSCTGIIAPGLEYYLMKNLSLSNQVNRLGINFMGCFGAFKGLSVARAFAYENPKNRILLVCTELCSLHLQSDQDVDNLIANSLFADGSAAVVIGQQLQEKEKAWWEMTNLQSIGIENSFDKMSWEASDKGFVMRLSSHVPVLIRKHIEKFIEKLLPSHVDPQKCDWAIHPGGKSIIQAIERTFQLQKWHTHASWTILSNYGNMSSATFLFVLDHLFKQSKKADWAIGLAFGPGLSVEGMLLRKPF